jgi:hypothetical protein
VVLVASTRPSWLALFPEANPSHEQADVLCIHHLKPMRILYELLAMIELSSALPSSVQVSGVADFLDNVPSTHPTTTTTTTEGTRLIAAVYKRSLQTLNVDS